MSMIIFVGWIGGWLLCTWLALKFFRVRRSNKDTWFGPHLEREAYYAFTDKEPPHDPKQCKQLLLRRAMRDVARIQSLQQDRQALQDLVRQGSMGDEMWQQFLDAEAEMNIECEETMLDAEDLVKGWGQNVFREAAQLLEVERVQQLRQAAAAEKTAREERDKRRAARGKVLDKMA